LTHIKGISSDDTLGQTEVTAHELVRDRLCGLSLLYVKDVATRLRGIYADLESECRSFAVSLQERLANGNLERMEVHY
jgi:hypothetical protein